MVSSSQHVKRGEIWLVNLDPTQGKEIQKTRPCVVLTPNEMNFEMGIVTVAPMTTGSHPAPFRVPVTFQSTKGLILLDQMRAVDKSRLVECRGEVKSQVVQSCLKVLQEMYS
ncbi:type II toxin-antitoxin system PemK/MazF family toxin [Comamonas odontotermitis]|uniref:type II toxin-antitoxin system PemK/MazF family toxin n=1 Tax=Comamonas odontotermitis TaxID=379895 RepID=UPI001CC62E08|nr:type II toxin-antitoxin system PemK/MazF family toxin [Comamonas odontotermitis]UBB15423.1 type II toxin-antitoxin system PemK/MazF family toxin [Comamonas odontotermitis]